jgi:protein-tyrosine-phosphatase
VRRLLIHSLYRIFESSYIRFPIYVRCGHERPHQSAFLSALLTPLDLSWLKHCLDTATRVSKRSVQIPNRLTLILETIAELAHVGINTQGLHGKSVEEFRDEHFDYVITLCDKSARECLAMPKAGEVLAWDFEDPVSSSHPDAFKTRPSRYPRTHQIICIGENQTPGGLMNEPITPTVLFKSLADDTRTKITLLIAREGELCVCELTAALDPEPTQNISAPGVAEILGVTSGPPTGPMGLLPAPSRAADLGRRSAQRCRRCQPALVEHRNKAAL